VAWSRSGAPAWSVTESVADHHEPAACGSGEALTRTPHEDQDMTTTTEVKPKRKVAEPKAPPTFEQIAERKLTEKLTAYRGLVTRAASGEQLPEIDLEAAVELLAFLGLPEYSWRRDIQAKIDHDAVVKAQAEVRAQRPANEKRLAEIAERLKAVESELASLREERHRLGSVSDHLLAGYMTRLGELEANHPHVLTPMEDAVRFRLEQQRKRQGSPLSQGASS